ncbi:hypothetical protein [Desulforudis sp. DRI-14]|uniref:hypothetical protein n=1 Tax=Desulforudis sp. DRI-14 TaxID=3459793 RepID=UPI004043101D
MSTAVKTLRSPAKECRPALPGQGHSSAVRRTTPGCNDGHKKRRIQFTYRSFLLGLRHFPGLQGFGARDEAHYVVLKEELDALPQLPTTDRVFCFRCRV